MNTCLTKSINREIDYYIRYTDEGSPPLATVWVAHRDRHATPYVHTYTDTFVYTCWHTHHYLEYFVPEAFHG